MPLAGGGFDQCSNAQAAVAAGSLLVVAVDVVQAAICLEPGHPLARNRKAAQTDANRRANLTEAGRREERS